jgi:hypothetical protein
MHSPEIKTSQTELRRIVMEGLNEMLDEYTTESLL